MEYKHFNEKIYKRKYELRINKKDYLDKNNKSSFYTGKKYDTERYNELLEHASKNYDINMEYLKN